MFVLQQLLGRRRRQEEDHQPTDDKDTEEDNALQQPPTKKIKTGHDNAQAATNDDTGGGKKIDPAAAKAQCKAAVFCDSNLLRKIVEYLNHDEELQLAACDRMFYVFFALRAKARFFSIASEADPNQRTAFMRRAMILAFTSLPTQEQPRFHTKEEPNFWQAMWMWIRGVRPPRWLQPHRYHLQCAYKVPVDLQAGINFGPSCSYGDRMYCLAAAGCIATYDAEPKPLDFELTRQAESSSLFSLGYNYIFDQLWYCATNNTNVANDNNKGYLVLNNRGLRRGNDLRVMDLSQTNQDIGRADSRTGIDQLRITPSDTFHNGGEAVVSESDGLIYFVGEFDGTIAMESYDMEGQLVASKRQTIEEVSGLGSHQRAHTRSVVSNDKLVIVYHNESPCNGDDFGFGIYVFDRQDFSFCEYTPLFRNHEIYISKFSKDWLVYVIPGTRGTFALRITGGNVGRQPTHFSPAGDEVLIAGNHVYAYNSPEGRNEEGAEIEFDQFDLLTGNKIRTLQTGIPWKFDDDGTAFLPLAGPAVEGQTRRLSRNVASAHVVGNKVVFLISSQGSAKNSIAAFALPPSP